MRTTVDIDTSILREVNALHEREGRPIGAVVSELLAETLVRRRFPRARPTFRWTSLDGFLDACRRVAGEPVRGNLVADAQIAAILAQHGVRTLFTNDRDFRKFKQLDARDPFA